ncbi:cation diffusion facilitator family transporter [Roseivivax marinus]|uniref:cation diffusion facilitator family transporter n=1 Tax=Roseivivax marinus TaxID=1379903 RepID=UPI001F0463E2|nr:cation diffusion facilitator family transporter [Roseivivax marinus]UMA65591.1 cation diffusion facilitator family transporter [Roseivivax marinus]
MGSRQPISGDDENQQEGRAAVLAALAGNAGIAVTKFIAAALSGSSAMLAEGFHSVVDTGNQACLLYGMRRAKKPADETHPFGYGQEIYFWAFVVAVLLFSLGAGFSIYEGIRAILHGEGHNEGFPITAVVVLLIAAVFEGYSCSVAFREFEEARDGKGLISDARNRPRKLWTEFRDQKNPSIFVVMCEDTAALAGIVIALLGVLLTWITGAAIFDAAASILIGILLAATAAILAFEVKELLIGEAADPKIKQNVREILHGYEEIIAVNEVRAMHLGPSDILLALSVDFRDDVLAGRLEEVVSEAERRIKEAAPDVQRVFLEVQDRNDHEDLAVPGETSVGTPA